MKKYNWYAYALLIAFCSLSYEFILIKLMSLIQGGRITHYNLIVSLFTFSLGLGALASSKVQDSLKGLIKVEFLLALIGFLSPVILLSFQTLTIAMLLASLIGFLSGFEVPLLMELKKDSDSKILAFDYFGMFLASLLIPLLFFKKIGLVPTSFSISLLNLVLAISLLRSENRKTSIIAWAVFLIVSTILIANHREINMSFSNLLIKGAI